MKGARARPKDPMVLWSNPENENDGDSGSLDPEDQTQKRSGIGTLFSSRRSTT